MRAAALQAFVGVGDHQAHTGQSAAAQRAQELGPERLVLGVADGEAEDLTVAAGGDPGGDHDRPRHDLMQVGVAGFDVGRVQVDVGELDVGERAVAERVDLDVELGADPRHLRLRDPRVDPQRLHQIVDRAGRDALDVGLHDHRVQRLIDPPARLDSNDGKKLPCDSFGIFNSISPAWVANSRGR